LADRSIGASFRPASGFDKARRGDPDMKPIVRFPDLRRRALILSLALLPALSVPLLPTSAPAQTATTEAPLPSWNDGPAKQAIIDFVRATTERSSAAHIACTRQQAGTHGYFLSGLDHRKL
jgi:hypothetical protein